MDEFLEYFFAIWRSEVENLQVFLLYPFIWCDIVYHITFLPVFAEIATQSEYCNRKKKKRRRTFPTLYFLAFAELTKQKDIFSQVPKPIILQKTTKQKNVI